MRDFPFGVAGLLAFVFVVLKVAGTIDWSWWLVLSPLWGLAIYLVACFIFVFMFMALTVVFDFIRRGGLMK